MLTRQKANRKEKVMAKKYVDNDGLLYFWQKIKNTFAKTSDVPTKTSDLTNDSGYITAADVPEGSAASSTTPKMDGTASVGTEMAFARGDHVHPVDTSRAPTSHASTDATYGKGTSSNYGHVKLSDSTIATAAAASGGTAATPKAVSDALKKAKSYADDLDIGVTDVTVDGTSVVTGGVAAVDLSGKVDKVSGKGLSTNDYTSDEKTKLAGIADGATKVSVGLQNGVIGFSVNGTAINATAIASTQKGAASGVCPLNASSKIDSTYLPSYVDDVIEAYARSGQTALSQDWLATGSASGTVITPEAGKIYVLMADSGDYTVNSQFRWGGSTYVKMNDGGMSPITNAEIDTIVAS